MAMEENFEKGGV